MNPKPPNSRPAFSQGPRLGLILCLWLAVVGIYYFLPRGASTHSVAETESETKTETEQPARELPFGIAERTPWTTSRVIGSPEPPDPYRAVRVFPELKVDRPLDLHYNATQNRWYICEDIGRILSFANDPDVKQAELFLDLRPKDHATIPNWQHRRLWSMAFHPKFAENGRIFVCYLENKPRPSRCRIVRFTVNPRDTSLPPKCDPDTEFLLLEWIVREDHFGGCLQFGPDGYLYSSTGDGSSYADGFLTGQDITDLTAAVIRIDVDHQDNGLAYSIPTDNPFLEIPRARGEVWAYGTRNIWRMSFDRETGDLWGGDVGQDLWEMVLKIQRGGNYGWSVTEGTHPFRPERKLGPTPILKPVYELEHSQARSITGGYVYRGMKFPELVGTYVYGDYDTGKIWGLRVKENGEVEQRTLVDTALRVVSFAEDADGELFILDYVGGIYQLEQAPPVEQPAASFPKLLSLTGLFADTAKHEPAPGVISYDVNSPLWSDGAEKQRLLAIPGDGKIEYHPTESWTFPEGTVLVKTFALDLEAGNPTSRKRLETRLLHLEQNHWRGYTYLWNDEQTDATLLDSISLEREYTVLDKVADVAGNVTTQARHQVWHFPSRAECTLCHTMPVKFVLGLNTPQLNRDYDYGDVVDNQLRTMEHLGLFTRPIASYHQENDKEGKPHPTPLPKLADPHDESASLDGRARSYLQANCSHCHVRWGGGNALFQLSWNMPLEATGLLTLPPAHGNFGMEEAKLLIPGDAEHSLLWYRMNLTGRGRMPHVASSVVDQPAMEMMRAWINQLPK